MASEIGSITYDLFTVTGTVKLKVNYEMDEVMRNKFLVRTVAIEPLDPNVEHFQLGNLQDEMDHIIEECVRDYAQRHGDHYIEHSDEEEEEEDIDDPLGDDFKMPTVELAAQGYDFSKN